MMRKLLVVGLMAAILPMTAVQAQKAAPKASPEDIRALEKTFGEIDRNRDGRLTKIEMSAYGHAKGFGVLVKAKGWKRMDADRNGTISRDEFVQEMIRYRDSRKR